MSRPISKLSNNYQIKLLDNAESQWKKFKTDVEDLQDKGVTLETLADAAGVSRWTIYRILKSRNNGFLQNFAIISVVSKLKEDYSKYPCKKRRKKSKDQLKNAEIRVVKGS